MAIHLRGCLSVKQFCREKMCMSFVVENIWDIVKRFMRFRIKNEYVVQYVRHSRKILFKRLEGLAGSMEL